jgi:hypothetical protein
LHACEVILASCYYSLLLKMCALSCNVAALKAVFSVSNILIPVCEQNYDAVSQSRLCQRLLKQQCQLKLVIYVVSTATAHVVELALL